MRDAKLWAQDIESYLVVHDDGAPNRRGIEDLIREAQEDGAKHAKEEYELKKYASLDCPVCGQ